MSGEHPDPADDNEEEVDELNLPASGSHFKAEHRAEVLDILTAVRDGGEAAHAAGTLRYKRVRDILEEYQEQGVLLRSVLPEFAGLLVEAFWNRATQDKEAVLQPFGSAQIKDLLVSSAPFEEEDEPRTYLHEIAVLAYVLGKVVGPKNLISHLPHDVRQFEYAFYYLIWSLRTHATRTWEIRYFLMLWMTNTVLVPFDLTSIDSGKHETLGLTDILLEVAQHCLGDPGRVRDVGALFVSRLLTRPDIAKSQHLPKFLEWCGTVLAPPEEGAQEGLAESNTAAFAKVGALSALAGVLKYGKRNEISPHLDTISEVLTQDHLTQMNNMLVCKTLVKAIQRLGLVYMKPRVVAWRYQRGMRSLLTNLHASQPGGAHTDAASGVAAPVDEDDDGFAPMEVEPIVGVLIDALRNADTIVRWSAAKGIGRITARLAKPEADDVVEAVLEAFDLYEDSNGWHGGCLALAELARRGLLLPVSFEKVVPITIRALSYEVVKGTYSVGRHVRDAGCYVCWSFARAYSPQDIAEYANSMSARLLATACFDREISVRRAAAAAFQECVGRLGNFPHGIDIVTRADYYNLSNRKRAYLQIAPTVASYDAQYHEHFATVLVENRLAHHDRDIRTLAAEALGELAKAESAEDGIIVTRLVKTLLDRAINSGIVDVRHGAVLGVAEVVKTSCGKLAEDVIAEVVTLMPRIEGARLYRGRGGEFVRTAVCHLITAIANAGVKLPATIEAKTVKGKSLVKTLGRYQQCLDENLGQMSEAVQLAASKAFGAFSAQYFVTYNDAFHGKVTRRLLGLLPADNLPNERRGAALGLGLMPHFVETHTDIIEGLAAVVPVEESPEERDAETRRNACTSLAAVACRMEHEAAYQALDVLAAATQDYTIDNRGDVGSVVRIAAMEGLVSVYLALRSWGAAAKEDYVYLVLTSLLRQATEKLDKVRCAAGGLLHALVTVHGVADHVSDARTKALLAEFGAATVQDWGAPQETYGVLGPLLEADGLRHALLAGIAVSAGGMSVHVSRPAFQCLSEFLQAHEALREDSGNGIAKIIAGNTGNERVILPALGTTDRLLAMDLLPAAAAEEVAKAVREEVRKSTKSIHILLPAVDVLCGVLSALPTQEATDATLHTVLLLIAGRFPKVRSKTGTVLYTTLMIHPQLGKDNPAAQDLLSTLQWDIPDADAVRANRDLLYPLLGLTRPNLHIIKDKPAAAAQKPALRDANADYSSLVRDAGY
eukprot:TRINITY_DN24785_c0_g1_i1.p1 TRINITY_DN24785_c0_g1~~TRINITY_DN24785_c0_g1_i1.p1  ORF type:complete len:1230 (+),score=482.20 TRINITY_DN24785_c0_g1_i1:64-3753(+)